MVEVAEVVVVSEVDNFMGIGSYNNDEDDVCSNTALLFVLFTSEKPIAGSEKL